MIRTLVLISMLIAVTACSSKPKFDPIKTRMETSGLTVGANWIKDDDENFDLQFTIANGTEKGIIILLADMSCYRGALQGQLKHTFFNTGERTIDFRPGELKMFNLICFYGTRAQGPYKIRIRKVYENEGGDGLSRGDIIAENIEWSVPDGSEK